MSNLGCATTFKGGVLQGHCLSNSPQAFVQLLGLDNNSFQSHFPEQVFRKLGLFVCLTLGGSRAGDNKVGVLQSKPFIETIQESGCVEGREAYQYSPPVVRNSCSKLIIGQTEEASKVQVTVKHVKVTFVLGEARRNLHILRFILHAIYACLWTVVSFEQKTKKIEQGKLV